MGEVHVSKVNVGDTITLKGTVKYIRTGMHSRDSVCIELFGKEIWIDIPKQKDKNKCVMDS